MVLVNISEAKAHLSRYIGRAEWGEVFVVCRRNKPVAEIRAVAKPARAVGKGGLLKGHVSWSPGAFAPMSHEELAEFDGAPVFPQ